jgi:hypothetical protein
MELRGARKGSSAGPTVRDAMELRGARKGSSAGSNTTPPAGKLYLAKTKKWKKIASQTTERKLETQQYEGHTHAGDRRCPGGW